MDPAWAAQNLQTIRVLMERCAIYRRALAPVMLVLGCLGTIAAAAAVWLELNSTLHFVSYWLSVSLLGLVCSFLGVRRQAIRETEPFWSPPTRRIAHAMAPALLAGFMAGVTITLLPESAGLPRTWWLPPIWMAFYGCALHAAGFFMPRGIRLFGYIFLLSAGALVVGLLAAPLPRPAHWGHLMMGSSFGGLHLIYGSYLYFTEKEEVPE